MKHRHMEGRKSHFWSRLLGLLISVSIIVLLVVGGVRDLLGELSAVHDELADSKSELALTQRELANSQSALASKKSELATAQVTLGGQARAMQQNAHRLDEAENLIVALANEREHLIRRWGASHEAVTRRNQQLVALDKKLRVAEAELDRLANQPQWSMIVTTERQMQTAYRERYAKAQVRMFAQGDGGAMYYEGMEKMHEVEQYASYAERTQVVWTTTAPGRNVLECLERGCSQIVAAQSYAMQRQSYSYHSQYSSMQMALLAR